MTIELVPRLRELLEDSSGDSDDGPWLEALFRLRAQPPPPPPPEGSWRCFCRPCSLTGRAAAVPRQCPECGGTDFEVFLDGAWVEV